MAQPPGQAASLPDRHDPPRVPGSADADLRWLCDAIELSRRCPASATAFSVGAVLVGETGELIATGYSRERDPVGHAEEVALDKAAGTAGAAGPAGAAGQDGRAGAVGGLAGATLYSSLEPCLRRASRPVPCAELIVAAGLRRVVLAWLEPPLFMPGGGARWLRAQGVTVLQIPELAGRARSVNAHLLAR